MSAQAQWISNQNRPLQRTLAASPQGRQAANGTNDMQVDLSRLYKGIDLPETLSNLTGKRDDGIGLDLAREYVAARNLSISNPTLFT